MLKTHPWRAALVLSACVALYACDDEGDSDEGGGGGAAGSVEVDAELGGAGGGGGDGGGGEIGPSCTPSNETCNGVDDDCDGNVDENLGVGMACTTAAGACGREGVIACDADGNFVCEGERGEPSDEICNGIDDDCDGRPDEDLGVGDDCVIIADQCVSRGVNVCNDAGEVICGAAPIDVGDEICNGADDDCDGVADEGLGVGTPCVSGEGACAVRGQTVCTPDGVAACDAVPLEPAAETCDGVDQDCDGNIDEGFPEIGQACEGGVGACRAEGTTVCSAAGEVICGAEVGRPVVELCNGIDDDCDGASDEDFAALLDQPCVSGEGLCGVEGRTVCAPDGAPVGLALEGVQQDLPEAQVLAGGFEPCWSGRFNETTSVEEILAECDEGLLMMGCRPAGEANLTVAAMGERDIILQDSGNEANPENVHNGVNWYFSDTYSWGFGPVGEPLSRNSCDTGNTLPDQRMCWHTSGGNVSSGYRCGATTLNGNNGWERIIYHRPDRATVVCDAEARAPEEEICDNIDNDCDGVMDEGFDVGGPCAEGIAACERGEIRCDEAGVPACVSVGPADPEIEVCNGRDDDCNGVVDDVAGVGDACVAGEGVCANEGTLACPAPNEEAQVGLLFEGIQQNLPEAQVAAGGFEACWSGLYNAGAPSVAQILEQCDQGVLMMGCRPVGADAFTLAAMGEREIILQDSGREANPENVHNGVNWYFSAEYSWGFGPVGEALSRNSCDTGNTLPEQRMCWHTSNGNMSGGYRCGANTLNGNAQWERVIYQRPAAPLPICDVAPSEDLASEEICDNVDNDCDGLIDEGFDVGGACDDEGVGPCQRGRVACTDAGELFCEPYDVEPELEICDGLDNDCDGEVDNVEGVGAACAVGVGACRAEGQMVCSEGGGGGLPFEGVVNAIPEADLLAQGFETCFAGGYEESVPVEAILEACGEDVWVMACRRDGEAAFQVAAAGEREIITVESENVANPPANDHNGVNWYWGSSRSIGFAPAGEILNRNSCDVEGRENDDRICWHSSNGNVTNGWRCGSNTGVGNGYERVILQRAGLGLVCGAEPGAPSPELCNGEDDDCDELTDEGFNVGEPCLDGVPACEVGALQCDEAGAAICVPVGPAEPQEEVCNGRDDDCNGEIDDVAGVGEACVAGEGVCANEGTLVCPEIEGGAPVGLALEGIQQNLPEAQIRSLGLSPCWTGLYNAGAPSVAQILEQCDQGVLMMGCRPVGADAFTLAAMGEREIILQDSGREANPENVHNGVNWYFSAEYSWGFGPVGEALSRNSCDTGNTLPEQRMCWHTSGGNISSGYRCGATFLNGNAGWERVIFQGAGAPAPICDAIPLDAAGEELCDGADNDCDGATDEELICE